MNCPKCNGGIKVTDTRPTEHGVRRRRECLDCGYRFTTREIETKPVQEAINHLLDLLKDFEEQEIEDERIYNRAD